MHRWRCYAPNCFGVPSIPVFREDLRGTQQSLNGGVQDGYGKVPGLDSALKAASVLGAGHGNILASFGLDSVRARGSLSLNSRINNNLLVVAEGWAAKDWRSSKIDHGFMAGLKLQW